MTQFLAIAFLCITTLHCVLGDTNRFMKIKECLAEQGYENSLEVARALMGKQLDTMPDVSREKVACALACAFKKNKKNNDVAIDAAYTDVINAMMVSDDMKKQMLDTVNTCKSQAENNDCKFLDCVKITESPFLEVLVVASNVPKEASSCIKKIGVTAEDIHSLKKHMYHSHPVDDAVKDKMACLMGCTFWKTMKPDLELSRVITDAINSDAKMSADMKKTMLESLNACVTQDESKKNCKLLQCLKIYDAPFVSMVPAIQMKMDESA